MFLKRSDEGEIFKGCQILFCDGSQLRRLIRVKCCCKIRRWRWQRRETTVLKPARDCSLHTTLGNPIKLRHCRRLKHCPAHHQVIAISVLNQRLMFAETLFLSPFYTSIPLLGFRYQSQHGLLRTRHFCINPASINPHPRPTPAPPTPPRLRALSLESYCRKIANECYSKPHIIEISNRNNQSCGAATSFLSFHYPNRGPRGVDTDRGRGRVRGESFRMNGPADTSNGLPELKMIK